MSEAADNRAPEESEEYEYKFVPYVRRPDGRVIYPKPPRRVLRIKVRKNPPLAD